MKKIKSHQVSPEQLVIVDKTIYHHLRVRSNSRLISRPSSCGRLLSAAAAGPFCRQAVYRGTTVNTRMYINLLYKLTYTVTQFAI